MRNLHTKSASLLFVGLLAISLIGCGPGRSLLHFRDKADPAQPEPTATDSKADRPGTPSAIPADLPIVTAKAERVADTPARNAKTILALSGGGSYGAFTAGVLNGWTKSNTRPEFDVVTGVSTGALIAPLAFLGSKYDADLKELYTEIKRRDILPFHSILTIPFRDSVARSSGLRKIVESRLTMGMMKSIAVEHRKGRRLYVATTDLDSRRNVVWDIGAIADRDSESSRQLVIDVLVASAAIPGVFPPVTITMEENGKKTIERHVDGGVTTPVFVPVSVFESAAKDANLYVIIAGKYYAEESQVRPRLLKVVTASGGALMSAGIRRSIANLYLQSRESHGHYHAIALPQNFVIEETKIDFDPAAMTKLFVEGERLGADGTMWDLLPPELDNGTKIRTGPRIK